MLGYPGPQPGGPPSPPRTPPPPGPKRWGGGGVRSERKRPPRMLHGVEMYHGANIFHLEEMPLKGLILAPGPQTAQYCGMDHKDLHAMHNTDPRLSTGADAHRRKKKQQGTVVPMHLVFEHRKMPWVQDPGRWRSMCPCKMPRAMPCVELAVSKAPIDQ